MPNILESCRCDISQISFGAQLEDGFFGERHSGTLKRTPATILKLDKHVAAKTLKCTEHETVDIFYWHATSLQSCDHPSIVAVLGVCVEGDDRRIVLEACPEDLASSLARDMPAATVWRWAIELADGLRYLHANQRVMSTVTVDNVVITAGGHAKWASVGPLSHAARATLQGGDASAFTAASDVFAFGELMFSMCRGHPDGAADREWPIADLIRRCRVADEAARPSSAELVRASAPFFSAAWLATDVPDVPLDAGGRAAKPGRQVLPQRRGGRARSDPAPQPRHPPQHTSGPRQLP
jgi:serine/threonine protein kinase